MKIEWLTSGSSHFWIEDNYFNGGAVYESQVRKILRHEHKLEVVYLTRGEDRSKLNKIIKFGKYLLKSAFIKFSGDIVIRDVFSTVFAPFDKKRKNIVLLHHLDFPKNKNVIFYVFLKKLFLTRLHLADRIVVVSNYWKELLKKFGYSKIKVIHNSFDLSLFAFDQNELSGFKKRLKIPSNKPIIYLGNARSDKGFLQSYEALSGLDALFWASGKDKVNIPIIQAFFSYRDYLNFLKISTLAITMSRFHEGWCRTAHEAMLCGTPVIGSGKGGMKELLEGGDQIICSDFVKLKEIVPNLLNNKKKLGEMSFKGKKFAEQFSLDYFKQKWLDLVAELEK